MKAHHIATIALASVFVAVGAGAIATAEYELLRQHGSSVVAMLNRKDSVELDRSSVVASNFDFKTYNDSFLNTNFQEEIARKVEQSCKKASEAPEVEVIQAEAPAAAAKAAQAVRIVRRSQAARAPRAIVRRVAPAGAPVPAAAPAVIVTAPEAPKLQGTAPSFYFKTDSKGKVFTMAANFKNGDGEHEFFRIDPDQIKIDVRDLERAAKMREADLKQLEATKAAKAFSMSFKNVAALRGSAAWKDARAMPAVTVRGLPEMPEAAESTNEETHEIINLEIGG